MPVDISNISLFLDNQSSPKTKSTYKWALERWFAFLGDRDESVAVALEFKQHLESTLKPKSAALVFDACRGFYRFLGGANPFENLKSPKIVSGRLPYVPPDTLVDKMLELCDNKRDFAILLLLLNGLRASEVANLTREGMYWSEKDEIAILKVVGKGNRERLVPITDVVSSAVYMYDEEATKKHPNRFWMFLRNDGTKMNLRSIEVICYKWSERAGFKISPHKLRHHYITRLVRRGLNLFTIQQLAGHQNISTTQLYTHLDLTDLVKTTRSDPRYQGGDGNDEQGVV